MIGRRYIHLTREEVYALNLRRGYNSRFSMANKIGQAGLTLSKCFNIAKT